MLQLPCVFQEPCTQRNIVRTSVGIGMDTSETGTAQYADGHYSTSQGPTLVCTTSPGTYGLGPSFGFSCSVFVLFYAGCN